jgi:hypothetical protein
MSPQGTNGRPAPGDGKARPTGGAKTARERAEDKRAEKLALVREQVSSGSLVIRGMTDEERRRYPPPTDPVKRPRRG